MLSSLMPLSNHFLLMINKLHPTGPNSVETHDALQLHNVKLLLWYYWHMMVHDGTWWYMMVHVMSYMHNIFDQIWSNMTAHPAGTWAWGNPNQRANENSHILGSCIKMHQSAAVLSGCVTISTISRHESSRFAKPKYKNCIREGNPF